MFKRIIKTLPNIIDILLIVSFILKNLHQAEIPILVEFIYIPVALSKRCIFTCPLEDASPMQDYPQP